tara:strand:+ start:528 stop:1355 length:828 start_codon:yes stop_codon:yes gene_type:complete
MAFKMKNQGGTFKTMGSSYSPNKYLGEKYVNKAKDAAKAVAGKAVEVGKAAASKAGEVAKNVATLPARAAVATTKAVAGKVWNAAKGVYETATSDEAKKVAKTASETGKKVWNAAKGVYEYVTSDDAPGSVKKDDKPAAKNKNASNSDWSASSEKAKTATGKSLNELVAMRKRVTKGSPEYNAIQNQINKSMGDSTRHETDKRTKVEDMTIVDKGDDNTKIRVQGEGAIKTKDGESKGNVVKRAKDAAAVNKAHRVAMKAWRDGGKQTAKPIKNK